MQDPDRTSHTLTCHQNSREAANAKKKREVKSRGSVVECGSLHRFGTCQKAAGTAALQDAPTDTPGPLGQARPVGFLLLHGEGGRRLNEGVPRREKCSSHVK